jgi:hypothetical protein
MALIIALHVNHDEKTDRFYVTTTCQSEPGGSCQHEIAFYKYLGDNLSRIADELSKMDEVAIMELMTKERKHNG